MVDVSHRHPKGDVVRRETLSCLPFRLIGCAMSTNLTSNEIKQHRPNRETETEKLLLQQKIKGGLQSMTNSPNTIQNPQTINAPSVNSNRQNQNPRTHYNPYKSSCLKIRPLHHRMYLIKPSASSPRTSHTPDHRSRHEGSIFHLQTRLHIPASVHSQH